MDSKNLSSCFQNVRISQNGMNLLIQWNQVQLALLNSIMRCIKTEIPTLAITEVEVKENSTLFPKDFLQHRIRFLPIGVRTLPYDLVAKEECKCLQEKYCKKCTMGIFSFGFK